VSAEVLSIHKLVVLGKVMSDFNSFLEEQLEREEVRREYARLAPFYRLAEQLILLRKQRGLTQKDLAEKTGTTQAVISRLENVSVHCSLESVIRLAEGLNAVVELKITPLEKLQKENDTDQMNLWIAESKLSEKVK
jgi:DNA-binding XRE family transcriptional regulator